MPMKRIYILLLLLPFLAWSCKDEEEILPDQQKRIVSFLTSSHAPRLVDERNLDEENDPQQPFYTTMGETAYRYIDNYFDPNRKNWKEVMPDSKVSITFRAYVFSYTPITDSTVPYFTNDPLLEEFFYKQGLTPGQWSFEPLEIDLQNTHIIKGLQMALVGCRQNDQVEVYMTYNMAYGEDYFGVIPKESPVAVLFTVKNVE